MRQLIGSLACLCLALSACSRRAEIAEPPDGGLVAPPPPTNPVGDAGLVDIEPDTTPPPCEERPAATGCTGANDFPCDFLGWANEVTRECQALTDCRSNGVLAVDMGNDGCVSRVAMSEPNAAFAACLRERFDHGRCSCGAQSSQEFLGFGNAGCQPGAPRTCAQEFPCEMGETCLDGVCTPDS
ncbi:MAG TPA: hypothetical protein VER33_02825 [Polyangiaceae bacterium]|nr:hypothetical protein [Polyangiaceae bacterium]